MRLSASHEDVSEGKYACSSVSLPCTYSRFITFSLTVPRSFFNPTSHLPKQISLSITEPPEFNCSAASMCKFFLILTLTASIGLTISASLSHFDPFPPEATYPKRAALHPRQVIFPANPANPPPRVPQPTPSRTAYVITQASIQQWHPGNSSLVPEVFNVTVQNVGTDATPDHCSLFWNAALAAPTKDPIAFQFKCEKNAHCVILERHDITPLLGWYLFVGLA